MRYALTGPSELTDEQRRHARVIVDGLDDPTEITTGARSGWDDEVALAALERWPAATHRVVCPGARYDGGSVHRILQRATDLQVATFLLVSKPPERTRPQTFTEQQLEILGHADVLVVAVRSQRYYRSREWMTVRTADRLRVPVLLVDLADL